MLFFFFSLENLINRTSKTVGQCFSSKCLYFALQIERLQSYLPYKMAYNSNIQVLNAIQLKYSTCSKHIQDKNKVYWMSGIVGKSRAYGDFIFDRWASIPSIFVYSFT